MSNVKITIEYNGERITVERDGQVHLDDIIGALKAGMRAAKIQWKEDSNGN